MSDNNEDLVASNFEQYVSLVGKFDEVQINSLIENEGPRLATSPSNAQKDEHGCFNGGMIQDTLNILEAMRKLDIVAGKEADQKSLWKVALLHNIGTIGSTEEDMFLPQDSDWHIEKLGLLYKRNQGLKTTNTERTIQILSKYGVELSAEEFFAILSIDKEKPLNYLGRLLTAARTIVCK
tara:strand:+ start:66 stop:605 length:540 start_codon:yes stop_codon:yes gene_type:complete